MRSRLRNRTLNPTINYEEVSRHTSEISIGSLYKSSGTRIDCALLSSRTKWGKLDSTDAAVVYLALRFAPPENHQLKKATVLIHFCPSSTTESQSTQDICCPNIMEYQPIRMHGPEWSRQVSWRGNLAPTVEAAGVSAGIGELERATDQVEAYKWCYDGGLRAMGQGHSYNLLECQWSPQKKGDCLPEHRVVKVGVVLRHNAESFFLKSSISDVRFRSFEKKGYLNLRSRLQMPESAPSKIVHMPAMCTDTDLQREVEMLKQEIEKDNLRYGEAFFPYGQPHGQPHGHAATPNGLDAQNGGFVPEIQSDTVISDILDLANTIES